MSAAGGRRSVGVAVAGFGWMGRVHTQAYARVLHHFPELPLAPELVAVAAGHPSPLASARDGLIASAVADAVIASMRQDGRRAHVELP